MNTKTPSFCYIAPTKYLNFTTASTTHLLLAHIVEKDEEYAEYYKRRSLVGDSITMDCSSYELKVPYSPDKLFELGKKCGADTIVLPDYPFAPCSKTIEAAEKYIDLFNNNGFKTFFVPQSKVGDLDDWIRGYQWASNNPKIDVIGMSILGIPNALPQINPAFSRVVMSHLLIDRNLFNFEKTHHFLGLNSGPALEIPSLIAMNVLDTIDSSGPIWSAILGHSYTYEADSFQSVSKIKLPVNFNQPLTKDEVTIDRIKHNIKLTERVMNSQIRYSVWYAQE